MSLPNEWPEVIGFSPQGPVVFQVVNELVSHDAGLLLFRQLDEELGMTATFAALLDDPRDPDLCDHTTLDLVRQRVYGILADYVDQNDAATLSADPIFKLILNRRPDGPRLASQPTLSRFENSINIPSLKRLRELLVTRFLDSFPAPPRHLTFDLDAVDDPAHGQQQLTFWHNYYDQNQYYPLLITNAETDQVVMASLRHGSAPGALGADDDLEYLVNRVRQRWPDVVIYVRGDCAFGIPLLCDPCERLRLLYTFGLTSNSVLKGLTEGLLERAVAAWQENRQRAREQGRVAEPVRLFAGFWYRAGSWPHRRWVVAKAEANELGTNLRLVVTNRPGAQVLPGATYDDYGMRGESENRNKELKCDLHMDRLSDHRFLANYFRLYLHVLALNLLVRMRRLIALPLEPRFTEVAVTTAAPAEGAAPAALAATDAVPAQVIPTAIPLTAATMPQTAATEAIPTAGATATVPAGTPSAALATAPVCGERIPREVLAAVQPTEAIPGEAEVTDETEEAPTVQAATTTIPTEALSGAARRKHFQQRRQRDVLGEGQPSTWRRLLIKAVAIVSVSRRGIVVRLSQEWPHLDLFNQILKRLIAAFTPIPLVDT
jgi:Transposase DDE domain group 1